MNIIFDKGRIIFEDDEKTISHREVIKTPLEEVQGVLKCSSCGGGPEIKDVDLKTGVFVCPFCGTTNTLPNFGRTPDGPHITSIRNTYYVNCNEGVNSRESNGRDKSNIEDVFPQNIIKTHLKDIIDVFRKR